MNDVVYVDDVEHFNSIDKIKKEKSIPLLQLKMYETLDYAIFTEKAIEQLKIGDKK